MIRHLPIASLAAVVLLAACGSDGDGGSTTVAPTTPTTAAPTTGAPSEAPQGVVLRYVTEGGCRQMGPNCATYVVYADGKVEVSRTGEDAGVEVTGTVPAGLVDAWLEAIGGIDLDALRGRLPAGSCQACVDGVDVVAEVTIGGETTTFDSTEVEFDTDEPFFHALEVLLTDVSAAAELPVRQR